MEGFTFPLTHLGLVFDNDAINNFCDMVENTIVDLPVGKKDMRDRYHALAGVIESSRQTVKEFIHENKASNSYHLQERISRLKQP